jgi:hypothetical protein
MDWPLDPEEARWLDAHLVECADCAAVATAYESQRSELRTLREQEPLPPRDLWARTAAAIEAACARQGQSATDRSPAGTQPLRLPVGAISGVLVVAVVVGASLLSRLDPQTAPATPSGSVSGPLVTATPADPTPLPIGEADDVAWLRIQDSGDADVLSAAIDEVCPDGRVAGCAPMDGTMTRSLKLGHAPIAVVRSPAEGELILVDRPDGASGATVYALPAATPTSRPSPTPPPSNAPAETPVPTPSQQPTESVEPSASPPASPQTTASPTGSAEPPASGEPTTSVEPTTTPEPPVEGAVAIATDVVLVGDTAAYSPDGRWFAFSARPADGSAGPDVFVWQSGQGTAIALTTDHRTVFASWVGGQVLASRAVPEGGELEPEPSAHDGEQPATDEPTATGEPTASPGPSSPSAEPTRFESTILVIDPDTGLVTELGSGAWRPAVGPDAKTAVYWQGTLVSDAAGVAIVPGEGRLVVSRWPIGAGQREPQVLERNAISDWDARWDATGTRLAVWVADRDDPDLGALSLYTLDAETGRLDRSDRPLVDAPARRGFSIAGGRLAWVTPAGQDGEGSRVQVLAWTEDEFGKVETLPGEDSIVVIR